MIKLSSFYPFANFLRITQEFYEEKALVKMKSLKFEREFEFEYKDVGEISDAFYADKSLLGFGFWILLLSATSFYVFYGFIHANLILLRIVQTVYLCGLFLFVIGFKRSWLFYISDRNSNTLVTIQQTRRNRDLLPQVLEIIRKASENVQEITTISPFPEENPAFEHSDYNLSGMTRTIDRFYENKIVGSQKSIYGEIAYNIQYDQLSGRAYHGKSGSGISEVVFGVGVVVLVIIAGLYFGFDVNFWIPVSYLVTPLVALYLLSLPLDLIKREVIGLYDKSGSVAYWTYVNKSNKEKVEKIIKFIQSKISPITSD